MTTLLEQITSAQRTATVTDVIEKMRRGGYLSYEVVQLGWCMGDTVDEAEQAGYVRTFTSRRTGKTMVVLTEAGWQYPISAAPTMAELIYQVRRGNGQGRTVEDVAYSLNVERRDLLGLIQTARELGLVTLTRDPRVRSGMLGLTLLGRGFCITHGATTGEGELIYRVRRGIECQCEEARERGMWRPVMAEREQSDKERRPQVGDLIAYVHPTQHRTLVGTIVRLEGEVPHIRLKGSRTVFECLSGEGVEIMPGHDPEPAPACPDCKGSGTHWWARCGCAHGCSMCDGAGHMGVFACPTCKGSGDAPAR